MSVRVVRSIADARGVDPAALEFALGEAIDTDALDALAENSRRDWDLRFQVDGHVVEVTPDGPVVVDDDGST